MLLQFARPDIHTKAHTYASKHTSSVVFSTADNICYGIPYEIKILHTESLWMPSNAQVKFMKFIAMGNRLQDYKVLSSHVFNLHII